MGGHNTRKLYKLIRDRAYTSGDLAKLARSFDAPAYKRRRLRVKLAAIDQQIEAMAPAIDIDDIRAIERKKPSTFRRGDFAAHLLEIMQASEGQPVSTTDLRLQMEARLNLPNETAQQRAQITARIWKQFSIWGKKGAVKRVSRVGPGRSTGLWVWVGL